MVQWGDRKPSSKANIFMTAIKKKTEFIIGLAFVKHISPFPRPLSIQLQKKILIEALGKVESVIKKTKMQQKMDLRSLCRR